MSHSVDQYEEDYEEGEEYDGEGEEYEIVEGTVFTTGGDSIVKKYAKGQLLGQGENSYCFEFLDTDTRQSYACKVLEKSTLHNEKLKEKLGTEIEIHSILDHPNIVRFEHFFEDSHNVYILMELCENQSLDELLQRRKTLSELEVRYYLIQLVDALGYLHENGIMHRDISPANCYINAEMQLKLGGFGNSIILQSEDPIKGVVGTPNFIAPEVTRSDGYSFEADIWSLGCLTYFLFCGTTPFEGKDAKEIMKHRLSKPLPLPDGVVISEEAKDLIDWMLELEPKKRPNLDAILDHQFINNGGAIPENLPVHALTKPLPPAYLNQFLPENIASGEQEGEGEGREVEYEIEEEELEVERGSAQPAKGNPQKVEVAPKQTKDPEPIKPKIPEIPQRNSEKTVEKQEVKPEPKHEPKHEPRHEPKPEPKAEVKNEVKQEKPEKKPEKKEESSKKPSPPQSQKKEVQREEEEEEDEMHAPSPRNMIFVRKWIDYANKFGIAYSLSDGTCGVSFNDNTRIVIDPQDRYFEYVEKVKKSKKDNVTKYPTTKYPNELRQKFETVDQLKAILEEDIDEEEKGQEVDPETQKLGLVYVKRWIGLEDAVMFRLSNRVIQFDFADATRILMSSEEKTAIYVNDQGVARLYKLEDALDSQDDEVVERVEYARQVLNELTVKK